MSVQCDAFLGLQTRYFLRIDLLVFFDFPRDFFTHVHIYYVRLWLSINNDWSHDWYHELVKFFSVSSICERTVFVYHYELHIFVANNCGPTRKIRRTTCRYSYDVNVFQVSIVLFEEDQKVRVVAYQIFIRCTKKFWALDLIQPK